MPLNPELRPVYPEAKLPRRDEEGHLVVSRAPEVTWEWAEGFWQMANERMEQQGIDRGQCQVVVLPNKGDVTTAFYRSLSREGLGVFPVATAEEIRYGDGEVEYMIKNEAAGAKSVYIITSLITPEDYGRVRAVADHYRHALNAQMVTLAATFIGGGRSDKNVKKDGSYVSKTINIRAEIGALAPFVDRMMGFEPHSSATQAYAAKFGVPFAPLSPWQYLINILRSRADIVPDVIVRPDIGRNLAAVRIGEHLGLLSVSFLKSRDETGVEIYELPPEDQELVRGRVGVLYDDEADSVETLEKIANANLRYGMKALYACIVHPKFTGGWRERLEHPLLKGVFVTDSRPPIGNVGLLEKIEIVSLAPLLREIIEADIEGVNFWQDEKFRHMILQEYPQDSVGMPDSELGWSSSFGIMSQG